MRRRPTMEKSEFFSIYKQMFAENGLERYTSEEVMEKFFLLAQIMRETNEKMNITAITEEREIIARHYIDCLFAAELLPAGANEDSRRGRNRNLAISDFLCHRNDKARSFP